MDAKKCYYMCFPGGKMRALTLSYDDGVEQDRHLVQILNHYGLKCTFNLGAGVLGCRGTAVMDGKTVDISKIPPDEVSAVYSGHEIAGHGLWHSDLTGLGDAAAAYEVIEDRRQLESLCGTLVTSFAYPFGLQTGKLQQLLRSCGYLCARTVSSTHRFDLPENLLAWNPTCHHGDPQLMALAEQFCRPQALYKPQLFYLWGHSYEFDRDGNWKVIKEFSKYVAASANEIWFATNGSICRYLQAFSALRSSADGSWFENPTGTDLWLGTSRGVVQLPASTVTKLRPEQSF